MTDISDYYHLIEKGFTAQVASSNGLLAAADCRLFPKPEGSASAGAAPNGDPARTPFREVTASAVAKQEIQASMIFPAHWTEQPKEHLEVTAQRMGWHIVPWVEETIARGAFATLVDDRNISPNGRPAQPLQHHSPYAKMYDTVKGAYDDAPLTWLMSVGAWAKCKAQYPRHTIDRRDDAWFFDERVIELELNDEEYGILYGTFNPGLSIQITDVGVGPFLGYPDKVKVSVEVEWAVRDPELFLCWQ